MTYQYMVAMTNLESLHMAYTEAEEVWVAPTTDWLPLD